MLDYCLKDSQNRFRDPNNKELDEHNLTVTTLENIKNGLHKGQLISHLIVEEADKVVEWELAIIRNLINIPFHTIFVSNSCNLQTKTDSVMWASQSILIDIFEAPTSITPKITMPLIYCTDPSIAHILNNTQTNLVQTQAAVIPENLPIKPLTFYGITSNEEEVH